MQRGSIGHNPNSVGIHFMELCEARSAEQVFSETVIRDSLLGSHFFPYWLNILPYLRRGSILWTFYFNICNIFTYWHARGLVCYQVVKGNLVIAGRRKGRSWALSETLLSVSSGVKTFHLVNWPCVLEPKWTGPEGSLSVSQGCSTTRRWLVLLHHT